MTELEKQQIIIATGPVRLLRRATGGQFRAELVVLSAPSEFAEAATQWEQSKRQFRAARPLLTMPEHEHWNWEQKLWGHPKEESLFLAIRRDGRVQGMMMLTLKPKPCRLEPGANCLYVEYLESAPWNLRAYAGADALYGLVGNILLKAAVEASILKGCRGRVSLHSLPYAEEFYKRLGFENLGFDATEGYNYFELGPR